MPGLPGPLNQDVRARVLGRNFAERSPHRRFDLGFWVHQSNSIGSTSRCQRTPRGATS